MKAFSIISVALFFVMSYTVKTTSAVQPDVYVRVNVPAGTTGNTINSATRGTLNFYANYAKKEYLAEVARLAGNSTRTRQLRGNNDEEEDRAWERHLLTCAQCKLQYSFYWCQTVRNECRRRRDLQTLDTFVPTTATSVPNITATPISIQGSTNCRQLTTSQGVSNITSYAASMNFASYAPNLAPNQAGATVFICDN